MAKHHTPFPGLPLGERIALLQQTIATGIGTSGKPLTGSTIDAYRADLQRLLQGRRWLPASRQCNSRTG